MRKPERERWAKQANDLIEGLGAEPGDESYPWRLKTKVGMLSLRVEANVLRNDGPGTVFTRFDSPSDAEQVVDCNPYSGKWNHHYFDMWTGPQAIGDLKLLLENII